MLEMHHEIGPCHALALFDSHDRIGLQGIVAGGPGHRPGTRRPVSSLPRHLLTAITLQPTRLTLHVALNRVTGLLSIFECCPTNLKFGCSTMHTHRKDRYLAGYLHRTRFIRVVELQ